MWPWQREPRITRDRRDGVLVLMGRSAPHDVALALMRVISGLAPEPGMRLVVDYSHLPRLSASCFAPLVIGLRKAQEMNGTFAVVSQHKSLREHPQFTELPGLHMCDTLDEALAFLAAPPNEDQRA